MHFPASRSSLRGHDARARDSPGHAGDEAAKKLLGQGLGQAAARLGGLVDDHATVEHVGAVGPERRNTRVRHGAQDQGRPTQARGIHGYNDRREMTFGPLWEEEWE